MAEKTFYDEFIEIYSNNIKRKGADKLLKWLMKSRGLMQSYMKKLYTGC